MAKPMTLWEPFEGASDDSLNLSVLQEGSEIIPRCRQRQGHLSELWGTAASLSEAGTSDKAPRSQITLLLCRLPTAGFGKRFAAPRS